MKQGQEGVVSQRSANRHGWPAAGKLPMGPEGWEVRAPRGASEEGATGDLGLCRPSGAVGGELWRCVSAGTGDNTFKMFGCEDKWMAGGQ